jgi:tRNA (cmo5U34)-methyltransferase
MNEWTTSEHASTYLARADRLPHRAEGEAVLLEHVPNGTRRILDLGTGDGRLLGLLRRDRPESSGIGLDISAPMLEAAGKRFAGEEEVELIVHDLVSTLPELGPFDAIVSSFAIHHLEDERKRSLYGEVFERLEPGGVFCNLEHVDSPTENLHRAFYEAIREALDFEDTTDHLLDVETQLRWLRKIGFDDVDCAWKWREMALLVGAKPSSGMRD